MYFSIEPLIGYLKTHPNAGKIAAFVISFLESVPVVGTIIPGSVTMTALGALIGSAVIPFDSTFLFAVIGALAGDTLGFVLGSIYHEQIRNIWPFNKKKEWLNYGERFLKKHGGKSILLGRFVGPLRSTMPLVAGALRVKTPIFVFSVIPSAFLWAMLYIFPGILVGALSMELPKGQATKFILIILGLLVLFWLVIWLIKRSLNHLTRMTNNSIDKLWSWLQAKKPTHFLINLITNQTDRNDHSQLTMVIIAGLSFICFIALGSSVLSHGELAHLNNEIFYTLQSFHTTWLSYLALGVTLLAQKSVILVGAAIFSLWLAYNKNIYTLVHWLILVTLSVLCIGFFKWAIHSQRPHGITHQALTHSFPSGHCLLAYTIFGFLAYLFSRSIKGKWHYAIYTVATVTILSVALSRLYLGAHWLSDVVGSLFLGTSILLVVICSHRRRSHIAVPIKQYNVVVLISFLLPWSVFCFFKFNQQLHNYKPYWPSYTVHSNSWWQNPFSKLPVYRTNRFGQPAEPFNIQWAGTLPTIKASLLKDDWKIYQRPKSLKDRLQRLGSLNPEYHMPILPRLYRNLAPKIIFIKHIAGQNSEIEIRLWQSGVKLAPNGMPVWLGNITYHHGPKKLLALEVHQQDIFSTKGIMSQLNQNLQSWQQKRLQAPVKIVFQPWDGSVTLIKSK